jgi:hypothetical protein
MTTSLNTPSSDQLHASALQFLIERREKRAAKLLLACEAAVVYTPEGDGHHAKITLRAPEASYRIFAFAMIQRRVINRGVIDEDPFAITPHLLFSSIEDAFKAVLPAEISACTIYPRAALVEINPEWRQELSDTLYGKAMHNQGLPFDKGTPLHIWKNLRFRSQTEIRVSEALEHAHVLFLPNCMARLGFSQRQNREADFLICHKGKWGILEVDGPLSHPPARTVKDHERDRLFKAHGIRLVEHFDAGECWENPEGVVKRFLYLLGR